MQQFSQAQLALLLNRFAQSGDDCIPGSWLQAGTVNWNRIDPSTIVLDGSDLTNGTVTWLKLGSTSVLAALDGLYVKLTTAFGGHVTGTYNNLRIVLPSGQYINFDGTENNTVAMGLGADGIRIGNPTGGDYILIEADGTAVFKGDATVWDDLRIVPGAFDFAGSGDPVLSDWQPGGSGATFKVYKFRANEQVFFTCQVPHTYMQGEDIYAHAHWTPGDRGNEESGKTVPWALDYSWANVGAAFGASATVDLTDTCTGTDHLHEMTPDVVITGTDKHISSMLACRFYRNGAGTWAGTTSAQSPALLEFDFHFPVDTVGSRERASK